MKCLCHHNCWATRWLLLFGIGLAFVFSYAIVGTVYAAQSAQTSVFARPEVMQRLQVEGELPLIVALEIPAWRAESSGTLARTQQLHMVQATQEEVLTRLAVHEVDSIKTFGNLIPYMGVTVRSPAALAALAADPQVSAIGEDLSFAPMLSESVPLIRGDLLHGMAYEGTGHAVAVFDTGVDKAHPALTGRVVAEACFSSTTSLATTLCPNGADEMIGEGAGVQCPSSISQCYHGTHVAGIAAGVAPEADLVAVQVFSRFDAAYCGGSRPCVRVYTSDLLEAMAYVSQIASIVDIASINMSLGGGLYSTPCEISVWGQSMNAMVATLRTAGIATVAAAGNDYARDAIASPACIDAVISVAATDKQDSFASFTNASPHVTLLAPGVNIYSTLPNNSFGTLSGTSMAAPHVAGAIALLRSALPAAVGTAQIVDRIEGSLVDTGIPLADPREGGTVIKPRIDLYAAFCSLVDCTTLRTLDVETLVKMGDSEYVDGNLITIVPDRRGVYVDGSDIEITATEPPHDDDHRCDLTWYLYVPDVSPDWHALPNRDRTIGVTMDHAKWFRAEWDCDFIGEGVQRSLSTTAHISLAGEVYTDDSLITLSPPNTGPYANDTRIEITAAAPELADGWGCELTWYWYVPDVSPDWHALSNQDQTIGVIMDHDKWFRAEWYCIYVDPRSYDLHTSATVQLNDEAPYVDASLVSVTPDTDGEYRHGTLVELHALEPNLPESVRCALDWYWYVPDVSPDWHLLPNHAQTIEVIMDHDKWFRAEWRCMEDVPTATPTTPEPATPTPTPVPTRMATPPPVATSILVPTATPTPTATPVKQYCSITLATNGRGAITYGQLGQAINATVRLLCDAPILLTAQPDDGWRFNRFELGGETVDVTVTVAKYELVVQEGDHITAYFDPAADMEFFPLIEAP